MKVRELLVELTADGVDPEADVFADFHGHHIKGISVGLHRSTVPPYSGPRPFVVVVT